MKKKILLVFFVLVFGSAGHAAYAGDGDMTISGALGVSGGALIGSSTPANSNNWGLQVIAPTSENYIQTIIDHAKVHGLTYTFDSTNNNFRIFSDYYVSGASEPGFVIGTYSHQNNQLTLKTNGNVGIGTTDPGTYKLYVASGDMRVDGSVYSNNTLLTSDAKFKKNLREIDDPLRKVRSLNGFTYEWKIDEYKDKDFAEGRHYGVIAQEVEKVLPEVVSTTQDGTKAVAYTEIIPVLIEAIKEQQKQIELLQNRLSQLEHSGTPQ